MMYHFLIVVFLVISCLSEGTERIINKEKVDRIINILRNTCQKKTQLDTEILDRLRRGEFQDNPKLKCYIKCVMKILQTMSVFFYCENFSMRTGVVDISMIERTLSYYPDRIERGTLAAKNCIKMASGSHYCEAAYNFLKCTYEEDPEIFFFP